MKMHRIMAVAASAIADSVFRERKVLDYQLANAFESNPKWGKRDRNFIAETVFEVVRWRRALSFLVGSEETAALCAAQWVRMGYDLPEWWPYSGAAAEEIKAREADLVDQPRAVRESIPDWLDALGVEELGDNWDAELAALNQRSRVFLRVNTLKSTRPEVITWLADFNITATEVLGLPDALLLAPGKLLPKPLRMDGRVEIQDAGSQMIAPLLDPQPGEIVIDACAGAGGKALHLAALMQNEGRVFGMDIIKRKLVELERRAMRANASKCIKTREITTATSTDYAEVADRLLIDAPCSGLGTLKRQPDLKWRLKPEQLDHVRGIQAELLEKYTSMLKPGGRLVYATCSILPSENRAAVDHLIKKGGFSLLKECPISPAETGYDGFYAAALVKDLV
jgi:16S rRNA (cytosine967-C5)-methyltransferase